MKHVEKLGQDRTKTKRNMARIYCNSDTELTENDRKHCEPKPEN